MADRNHSIAGANRQELPFFAARLFPYRSLSRRGFVVLMLALAIANMVAGVVFLALGAWPVLGFLGLDVLLVWLAFKTSYRSGRAFEEIAVWPHHIVVHKVSPHGKIRVHRFNPFWTRLQVLRHEEIGITAIFLSGEGRQIDIGSFLNPPDRESFAKALGNALASLNRR